MFMPVIKSVKLRRKLGMHMSGNEIKDITRKSPNKDMSNADKSLKKDIDRIAKTINHTEKDKCHEMANFLISVKGTYYYTDTVKKAINEYVIKHVCSKKAKDAIIKYTGSEFVRLNYFLRTGLPLNGTLQEIVDGLNEVYAKNTNSDYVLKTFRGVSHKTELSKAKEGDIITIKGYLSTSRDVKVAKMFTTLDFGVILNSNAKGELDIIFGKNHCDISGLSEHKDEQEELYPHGAKFRKVFQCNHENVTINVLEEVSEELGDAHSGENRKTKEIQRSHSF